jgi:hypothetical protein
MLLTPETETAPEQAPHHLIGFIRRYPLGQDAPERRIEQPLFGNRLSSTDPPQWEAM